MQKKITLLLYCTGVLLAVAYIGNQHPEMSLLTQATIEKKPVVTHSVNTRQPLPATDPTDAFINLPDEPPTQGYAPTSIKDFEAADPATGISMIPVPSANSLGNAVLNFTMNLPEGRQGMNPLINLLYNNEGGTTWLGTGWNLLTPSVSIDTRWGVPRYDAALETEMYLLNGEQLAPVNNRDTLVARKGEKRFYPRVEEDFSKIIRHGNSPATYWWEVAEKNGRKNYYGGRPGTGVVNEAVLKDDSGHIAYWALTETRDLFNNNVRYEYETVNDPGLANSTQQGRQLYLRRLFYTGHGAANGAYKLEFIRDRNLGETKRKDIVIDARLGFKQVSTDLLRKVHIYYNASLIRSYEFSYKEGAFYKTLLTSIKELDNNGNVFYSQAFDYYDDARANNTYKSSASLLPWQMPDDNIKGGIINPIPQFEDHGSAISVAKVKSASGGLVITLGGIAGGVWSKKLTVGGGFTYGQDHQEEILSLIDINGDGLPDKVFKQMDLVNGLRLYYRPNLGGTVKRFGDKKLISGLIDFGTSVTENIGGGGQALPYSGFFGYQHMSSTTTSKIYFSDFNGDGLIDIADGGVVYFNHLNAQGDPVFTTDSKQTPSPIFAGRIDPALIQKDTARQSKQERDFPLQDIIRFWQAPMSGTIDITAPVQLLDVPNQTGFVNNKKDGVRVSIQAGASDTLWSARIGPNDFTVKTPTNVSGVPVTKGERIYFRLQSIYNGQDDIVQWDPIIQYTSAVTPQSDVHHKASHYYRASEDFVLHSKNAIGMGKQGAVVIDGRFKKQATTDSVYVQVTRNRNNVQTTLFTQGYSGNELVDQLVQAPGQFAVDTGDELYFSLVSKSYIDRSAMQWTPHYAYVAFNDGTPVTSGSGAPLMEGFPVPDNSNFNWWLIATPPVTVSQKDTVILWPQVSGGGDGTLWFTIKGNDTVYARRRIYMNGGAMNTAMDSIRIIRNANEPLFLEYATDSLEFANALAAPAVNVYMDSSYVDSTGATKDTIVLKGVLPANLYTNPAQDYLGPQFRGWGQFAFKGDKGDVPIDETKLNLDEFNNYPTDPNAYTDTASMGNMPDPSKANFVTLYADRAKQLWLGYDTSVYVTANTMSSSRLYMHDVTVDSVPAGAGAIYKISTTETDSYSIGVTASGVGPSGGLSYAETSIDADMVDFNGDRYPDALRNQNWASFPNIDIRQAVQYTLPHGGLGGNAVGHRMGSSVSSGKQKGVGFGGEFEKAFTGNKTTKSASGAQNAAKAGMGVSGSLNLNEDNTGSSWMDMNGDGLPDRIFDNGTVMLNLGYRFAAPEQWDVSGIDRANSLSYGGGLGINIDGGSFEGGFGISRTEGRNSFILNDLNGDGLPDQLSMNDEQVWVRFNTGTGFGPAIQWKGFNDVAAVMSVGESFNMALTVTIPIYIIFLKICINPSGNGGQGASRQEKAFMDIDGDGYADYVESKDDAELIASASAIGRTNMLRSVKGPIGGAFFTMNYERVGNTYDMPQSKWVLKDVMAFDGVPGDGIDTIRRRFDYEGGRQDRYEREFYGFSKVITRELNTADQNKVYRSHVQTYLNTTYYNKGLPASEWMEDAAGHKYTQTNFVYDIKPVQDSVRFPALQQTEKWYYEGAANTNVKSVTSYEYDALGNITRIEDIGDGTATDRRLTTIAYHDNDNLYLKSVPAAVEIATAESVKRKRTTTINSLGAVVNIQAFLADGTAAVTDLAYDAYGNVTTLTKPANYKNQRMSYVFEYDDAVHSYPVKVTDAFGYITTSEYDYRFGVATRTVSRNDEPTEYLYDNHGRIIRFTGPYELAAGKSYTIAVEYHHGDTVPYAITKHYDPEYNSDINVLNFDDGWGRSIQLKKQVSLFKGASMPDEEKMVVSGTDVFDAFGRVIETYYPVLEAIGAATGKLNGDLGKPESKITFDAADRPVKLVYADNATTHIAWTANNSGLSTMVTDALGNRTERLSDVHGRIQALKTYGAGGVLTTRYDYNALGEMVQVTDPGGNTFKATFDNLGRKTAVQHPDAGETTFEYDLAGNLLKKITAQIREEITNGGAIQYQYDYDRLTDIDYPRQYQNKVKYTYGAPGTGAKAGRVTLQEDGSGGQEFFYSMQGQVVKTIRTVLTNPRFATTYVSEQAFDSWNRLKKMVYPDGEEVMYHYNKSGGLQRMDGMKKGSSYQFVDQVGYDEFDQRVYMRYSNGTENRYRYDSLRRRLTQVRALSPTGQSLMNHIYQYDAVSNVTGVTNDGARQEYRYDALYRLDSAIGTFSGAGYGLKMEYDNLNNIVHKRFAGPAVYDNSYTYGNTAPHQATQIGANHYRYDANGNQLGYGDIENFYDEENRLMAIINQGVLNQYTYDADDNRVVKSSGGMQSLWLNGAPAGAVNHTDNYTVYVSPYVTAKKSEFVKHYYIEDQRVASKPGHGTFTNITFPQTGLTAGGVDYMRRAALIEKARNDYYASLGVSPGPPTDKQFWARPENTGIAAPVFADTTASDVPQGWPGNTTPPPNGPPVFISPVPSRDSVKAGYGFEEAGHIFEGSIYFYHVDNTGSTNYVTNFKGDVIQHAEYAPTGELFFYEQTGSFETPYLFNGKSLDGETGYYNYNTEYYDPVLSRWLCVPDPTGEVYPGYGAIGYSLTGNNDDGDMVANPVVSKISYSGSMDAESELTENKADGESKDKLSKDRARKINNNPKRKIIANRYANLLLENRYNRNLADKDKQAQAAAPRSHPAAMPAADLPVHDDFEMWSDPDAEQKELENPVRLRPHHSIANRRESSSVVRLRPNRISNVNRQPLQRMSINDNLPVTMHINAPVRRNTGFRNSLSSVRNSLSSVKR